MSEIPELKKNNRGIIKAFKLNDKEALEIDIFCAKHGTNISNLARVAIKNYMKQYNKR